MSDTESIQEYTWKRDKARMEFETANELNRPFMWMKPKLFPSGNMWCVLLGDNLQEGVAGFGETPSLATYDFDRNWYNQRLKP